MKPQAEMVEELEGLLAKATPGNLSTAEITEKDVWHECPFCAGAGDVTGETYTNFDNAAIGVQFFGVGSEHVVHRELWEACIRHLPALLSAARQAERMRKALEDIAAHPGPHDDESAHWCADTARAALARAGAT